MFNLYACDWSVVRPVYSLKSLLTFNNPLNPEWDVLLKERRQFIELASELKLNKLMLKCEEAYLMVIDSANCLETMIIFDKYGSGSIAKRNVIIFIHDNFQRVSSSFQWTEFLRNHPKLVKMIKSPSYANTLII